MLAPSGSFFLFGVRGVGKSTWTRDAFPNAHVVDLLDESRFQTLVANPGLLALELGAVPRQRVIVLDDPLSAVDTETERLLVDNLRPAVAGRTVLVATQRLSTVQVADRAVVLYDGAIVEDGTPAELLERDGWFTRLFGDEVLAA